MSHVSSQSHIEVPSVTMDDLTAFHSKHFGRGPVRVDGETAQAPGETIAEDSDELGYYDDGVKRHLTNEQIAMFRHSEIQKLLRERELRREAAEEEQEQKAMHKSPPREDGRPRRGPTFSNDERTQRRAARELDGAKTENVELDY
ncbi:MAG: hypothetical protein M1828_005370 [Chrysothrix sp. TS-e1954]|nr:MAG: hypothetical protein M1828_005370 [Chrysothrix sp. TS-e1954]